MSKSKLTKKPPKPLPVSCVIEVTRDKDGLYWNAHGTIRFEGESRVYAETEHNGTDTAAMKRMLAALLASL